MPLMAPDHVNIADHHRRNLDQSESVVVLFEKSLRIFEEVVVSG